MSQSDFVTRGQALVSAGQFQEAVKVCRLGLLGRPTTVEGRVVLGQALLALKRYDEVLAEMRVALELDHASLPAQTLKGEALLKKGDAHGALEILQRACMQAPDDARAAQLLAEAKRSAGRPAITASHPAVGFLSDNHEDTRHYPNHGADDEDTSDEGDDGTEGYTRPTLSSANKKRAPRPDLGPDATPPPAVLAVGDKSGTVEVDPDIDGVELPDDDFDDVAAPPRAARPQPQVAVGGARGQVVPARPPIAAPRVGVSQTAHGRAPGPGVRKAQLPAPNRGAKKDISTVELEDDDMLEAHETMQPNNAPRRPGPGTAVRNAVGMPSGPLDIRQPAAASRPTAAAPAMLPSPAMMAPPQNNMIRGNPIAAALPTVAAQPVPPPMAMNQAAIHPTMAINAPAEPVDPAWARATMAASPNAPTQRPLPALVPPMSPPTPMPMPMPMQMQMLEGSAPAVAMLEPSQSSAKSLKTGMRKSRSKLQIFVWFLIGGIVIGGGVFAGFQIRAMRLGKQIGEAREQAVALAKSDTWKGWLGARDRLLGIAQASGTVDNRAALARTRALVAYEFGDGLPEAKGAYDQLAGQSSLDIELAGAYIALAQNDAKAARTAADAALALSSDDPAVLYVSGQAMLLAGDVAGAIKNLKSAVEKEPRPIYAIALARAYHQASAYADALTVIEKARGAQPEHPGVLVERGLLATTGTTAAQATELRVLLQKVASEGNKSIGEQPRGVSPLQIGLAYLALMQLDYLRGDLPAVNLDRDSALAVKLDDEHFAQQTIESLYSVGDFAFATKAADIALAEWPADRRIRVAYARVLIAQGRAADALAVLAKIPDIKDAPVALAARGQANLAAGDVDDARHDFEAALKKLPNLELAIIGRAWADIDGGDLAAARKAVEPKQGVTQSTAMATVYAATLRLSGDAAARDQAKVMLEKVVAGPPSVDLPLAQLELARLYRDLGDRLAKQMYAEASRSGNADARLESGLLLIEWSDPQGGKDQIDGLLKATPSPPAALVLEAARAHMLVGDHAGAIELLDQANKSLPQQLKWKYDRERGRLALRKGDLPGASIVLASALEGCGDDVETFFLAADVAAVEEKQPSKLGERVRALSAKRLKNRPEMHIITGKLLNSKGDEAGKEFEVAQSKLDKASQRQLAQAHLGRAIVKYNREEDIAATDALESALTLDPSLYEGYLYYADINKVRDPKKALAKAQLAAQYNPDSVDAYEIIGVLALKLGQRKVYDDAVRKLGEIAPNSDRLKNLQKLSR